MAQYAIYFDEGQGGGYLLTKSLKTMTQGEAMVVRRVQDGELRVRKRMKNLHSTGGLVGNLPTEVYIYGRLGSPPPRLFPQLLDRTISESCSDCAIIYEFCNGGDLDDM